MKKIFEKLSDIFYVTKSEIRLTATIFGIVLIGYVVTELTPNYDVSKRSFQNLLDSLKNADSIQKLNLSKLATGQTDTLEIEPNEVDSNDKIHSISSFEKEIGNSLDNPDKNLGKFQTYPKKELPTHLVDLNTASMEKLKKLPGVGDKTAELIIQHRRIDLFRQIEDIQNVKGIGPKKFAKMKPYITVKKKQ